MTAPYLRMHAISKHFPGVAALKRADLEAYRGEAMALMGANGAGKSTLMHVLGGIVSKDEGEITVDGRQRDFHSPIESLEEGVGFVYQELNSLPSMTIAENIFADGFPQRYGRIDFQACEGKTREILQRLGSQLNPRATVEALNTGDRQLIEIARALRRNPKILIFDEPTSSLSQRERQRLFDVIAGLKRDGVAIIYITHFVDEIFAVCERVTVMRNGKTVFKGQIDQVTSQEIVHEMMGTVENESRLAPDQKKQSHIVLEVDQLSRADELESISLSLREGEIVGIWGLLGSGRTELIRAMIGLDPIDHGRLRWRGQDGTLVEIAPESLHALSGIVTEDRRGEGVFLPLSTSENIILPNIRAIANRVGIVDRGKQKKIARDMIRRLGIKVTSEDQTVATLSGGNQQKVVFGRSLASSPRLFLLDEPTRGLDVGAKTEILKLILDLAAAGAAIVLVSSELEELTRICDRYLVMSRGRIVAELPGTASKRELLAAISTRRATPEARQ
jgi:ribose transport system ATP-binding protein